MRRTLHSRQGANPLRLSLATDDEEKCLFHRNLRASDAKQELIRAPAD